MLAAMVGGAYWYFSGDSDNAVRAAVAADSLDLTLADYKAGTKEERAELIAAYVGERNLPESDLGNYITCMGWNAATKSETLEFASIFGWCEAEAQNNRAQFEHHFNQLEARDLSGEAGIICQDYVKDQLVAPGSANFPLGANVFDMKRQRYVVKSHVDAQNLYGAMLRSHFHCDVQFIGGKWRMG